MSEQQDDYEVGGAEIGPHLLQAHTFSEGEAKFYIGDGNITDENMKDMAENDPAFLSFAEKSRLLFGDKVISPEVSVRDFFEANDISPSATVNEKMAFFIAQQQKVQSSKKTKNGSGKSAATPFSSKKGRPEKGNKSDSSGDFPSQSILFASPMPSNKSTTIEKENSNRVMHPQSEKINRRKECLRTPNDAKSTTEKPPLTASTTYNSKNFQQRNTASDYNYIHFDYAGISPRSSHAITMDNPATRSLYLQRQGSAVKRNTKRYGTPQLAGRLGVDRFPDAPKHFIRTWDGGAELYTPKSALPGGRKYSHKKKEDRTNELEIEAQSDNEVDSSSNETEQNHEVVTDADYHEMEQARREEFECQSEPDPELELEPEFESDDFVLALHDDQKLSPESGSLSAEEEQEDDREEVQEEEHLQEGLEEEPDTIIEEKLGFTHNDAVLPSSTIAERFFNDDKRMSLPAIHTSSTACLSFDEIDMNGKTDPESDESDVASDTQTKEICPRRNERSVGETDKKKMGSNPSKTALPGTENSKVETSCACVIQ